MNAKPLIVLAAFASIAAGAARADDIDPSQQFALQIQSTRTRAEVQAEAARVPTTRSTEPAGSRVHPVLQSNTQVSDVRAEAVQAVRLGQISRGEASM
ncbi:hypothetical protein GCM10027034_33790 [Ramlibacter solisilvae]|uniref:DUF4148 domain-containing protein n=1 Tax=Ramlibacter tataouinensis TaxID=94132 RepID=A0A127JSK4_9BURK|nr:DUF4148 domain-containing protein [Ramlibacter tataouinensis]AMO22885.1 hypothetical protein UC35_08265 [Ramlibacter tataouinensis]